MQVVDAGRAVQAHDGVGHVELVLLVVGFAISCDGQGEVEGGQIPVEMRQGFGELVGLLAREGRD